LEPVANRNNSARRHFQSEWSCAMRVITANRLSDGLVVYLAGGRWDTSIGRASVLHAVDALEAGMLCARRAVANREVVDVNAIEVSLGADRRPVPLRLRERIRAYGPTTATPAESIAA